MGKLLKTLLVAIVATLCFCVGVGCKEDKEQNNSSSSNEAMGMELSVESLELRVGENYALEAFYEEDGTPIWSSSNTAIVTVDEKGEVSAIAEGNATITATLGELTATCTVTVKKAVLSLHFYETEPNVKITDEYVVAMACVSGEGLSVEWTLPETDILEIVNKQTTVVNGECKLTVKAKKVGKVALKVVVGEAEATINVTVTEKYELSLVGVEGSPSHLTAGNTYALDYLYKRNGEVGNAQDIVWSVSDETLASVEDGNLLLTDKTGSFTLTGRVGDAEVVWESVSYKAIRNADDWGNIQNDLTGNYYLANDINFEGAQIRPIAPYSGTGATSETQWLPQYGYFDGVFDGNGYALKNFSPRTATTAENKQNALFGAVGENGIIRNVSVLGVTGYLGGSPLVYCHLGTVENAYVEMRLTGTTTAINKNNPFAGVVTKIQANGKVANCIAIIDCTMEDKNGNACVYDPEKYGGIAGYVSPTGLIENCYAYNTEGWSVASLPASSGSVKHSQVFSNGNIFSADFTAFAESGVWTVENGRLPRLKNATSSSLEISSLVVTAGSSVKLEDSITATGLYRVELEATSDGIILLDNEKLSVEEGVATGTAFKLTITLFGDATKVVEYEGSVTADVSTLDSVVYYDISADSVAVNLTDTGIVGTPTAVRLEGKDIEAANIAVVGGVLTVSGVKSKFYTSLADLGEKEIIVETADAIYQFKMTVVSKIIRQADITDGDPACLDAIFYRDEYKETEGSITNYNGYFVLGEDLTFVNTKAHALPAIFTSTNVRFNGVFDGLGYKISDYAIAKTGGMFSYLGVNAVVKNIHFDAPVFKSYQGHGIVAALAYKGAVVEDIYMNITYETNEGSSTHQLYTNGLLMRENSGTIRNCIVVVTDSSTTPAKHGYLVSKNLGEMENCYVIATLSGENTTYPTVVASSLTSTGTHTTCKIFENTDGTGFEDFYADVDVQAAIVNYGKYWKFDATNKTIGMQS